MKVFVVGSLNMDLVVKAPRMPRSGETLSGEDFMTNSGGKGANQAVALAKLGAEVYMVGCVGKEFGTELLADMLEYGVKTDYIKRVENVSSGIAVIVVVDGDNRIILDKGANGKVDCALIDKALERAQAGDYFVVQLEIGIAEVVYAMKEAKKKGLVTVLNPAPAVALPQEIYVVCDYFIPNQSEAEFYTGIYPEDELGARRCGEELASRGVKNVVITMGERGSVAVCEGEFYQVSAVDAGEAIDTTAAGDTYVGALVTKLAEGVDVGEAMQFASSASAITVTRRGAQRSIPLRAEVEKLRN